MLIKTKKEAVKKEAVKNEGDTMAEISELTGKLVTHIDIDKASEGILITCDDGSQYQFMHEQNCCESVYIVDSVGDLHTLVGKKLICVDQEESTDIPKDMNVDPYDSYTITQIRFVTDENTVISRWIGESNGYYSESVDLLKIK